MVLLIFSIIAILCDPSILIEQQDHSADFCDSNCIMRVSSDLTWTTPSNALLPILTNQLIYNRNIPPGQVRNRTTNVHVAVYIESMSSFQAQTMDYEVDMYLAMCWFDRRLKHEYEYPILVVEPTIEHKMWLPDLYFVNSKQASFATVTSPNFMVLVYPDGFVFKSLRLDVTLSCMMDLKIFPLDEQECPLNIQSYAYVENVLNLSWFVKTEAGFPISYNPEIRLNDMHITGQRHEWCSGLYPMFRGSAIWSCLKGFIRMKRLVMFHILQTYIPTTMLVCISWLSFWLDCRASPARISLTITTLLTLVSVSNGVRQDLPQVSYIKAIDIWLTTCTAFVFCVLLEYTMVCFFVGRRVSNCSNHGRRMTAQEGAALMARLAMQNGKMTASEFVGPKGCPLCAVRCEKIAKRIDRTSRGLFPATFLVFASIYWSFYLYEYQKSIGNSNF